MKRFKLKPQERREKEGEVLTKSGIVRSATTNAALSCNEMKLDIFKMRLSSSEKLVSQG